MRYFLFLKVKWNEYEIWRRKREERKVCSRACGSNFCLCCDGCADVSATWSCFAVVQVEQFYWIIKIKSFFSHIWIEIYSLVRKGGENSQNLIRHGKIEGQMGWFVGFAGYVTWPNYPETGGFVYLDGIFAGFVFRNLSNLSGTLKFYWNAIRAASNSQHVFHNCSCLVVFLVKFRWIHMEFFE